MEDEPSVFNLLHALPRWVIGEIRGRVLCFVVLAIGWWASACPEGTESDHAPFSLKPLVISIEQEFNDSHGQGLIHREGGGRGSSGGSTARTICSVLVEASRSLLQTVPPPRPLSSPGLGASRAPHAAAPCPKAAAPAVISQPGWAHWQLLLEMEGDFSPLLL